MVAILQEVGKVDVRVNHDHEGSCCSRMRAVYRRATQIEAEKSGRVRKEGSDIW